MPGIKVRNNSPSYLYHKNNIIRNKEKLKCKQETFSNGKRKEKKRKYDQIWIVETAFSSIKRMFGEHSMAIKFQNMVEEMMLKVSLYNLFTRPD